MKIIILVTIVLLVSCVSGGGTRIDNIPMYGQPDTERPESLKKADEDFIRQAVNGIGNREEASKVWWHEAEKYMNEGNLDYAMRRYNQSWLLNPNNYQPYWGFARVMVAKRQYEESFKYFQKAAELINDPYEKPALLSDYAIAYHNKANSLPLTDKQQRVKYFNLANSYFEKATNSDPEYPKSWLKWAFSLYFQENYQESWAKVKNAQKIEPGIVPDSFLSDLRTKLPEPK
ncbi:MAG: hypothetical protein ABW096_16510 [Candidatus Thiodiazotropha sp.]